LARAEIYGSLSRRSFSETSDLDLRFIARAGFANGFLVAHAVFLERLWALLHRFPLDLYMFHSEDELRAKMNVAKEKGLVVYRADEAAQALSVTDLSQRMGGEISLDEDLGSGAEGRRRQ
jgi:predicted nucleotidyltransferase